MLCAIRSHFKLRRFAPVGILLILATVGCSKSDATPEGAGTEQGVAPKQDVPVGQLVTNEPAEPIASDLQLAIQSDPRLEPRQRTSESPQLPAPRKATSALIPDPTEFDSNPADSREPEPQRKLRDDMSPAELVNFLAMTDKDMEMIHMNRSGIEDPREARRALLQIVDMKLQASRKLAGHPNSTEAEKSEGNRGELQSLSHKAALSDVKAAEELEKLAQKNMESNDPRLVADSRLVLIGFAIESLQNGNEQAGEKIVQYTNQIGSSNSAADVPALIVMGQAKQMLESYGQKELAKNIRDTIIATFGDSKNPDVANMAAQFAGNVLFDGVDKVRDQILNGDNVSIDQWIQSVERLIDESADIQTVGYLAGASVDFEAHGLLPFAEATLKTLSAHFTEPEAATTREVETAVAATAARQRIIGKEFDPDLPSINGAPLSLKDYRGKVVLVPFWAMGIPTSLQAIPILQSVQDANADKVAIVGVNLDPAEAPVEEFLQTNKLLFPSFSLASDQLSTIPKDFGVVSMPFVAILDKEGNVAAIQLSDKNLTETVQQLISAPQN